MNRSTNQIDALDGPWRLASDDSMSWAAQGPIFIFVPGHALASDEILELLTARYRIVGRPLAMAVLVREGIARPDERGRAKVDEMSRRCAPMLACEALVIEGAGFVASIFLNFAAALSMIRRGARAPMGVHRELEGAAGWIAQQLGEPNWSQERILETLVRVREATGRIERG